jgi:hypothetical protein
MACQDQYMDSTREGGLLSQNRSGNENLAYKIPSNQNSPGATAYQSKVSPQIGQ